MSFKFFCEKRDATRDEAKVHDSMTGGKTVRERGSNEDITLI